MATIIKVEYETQTEKEALMVQYEAQGYTLIEDEIGINTNWLSFRLKSEVDAENAELERLKAMWQNIKDDPLWQGLRTASYQQIDNWIDNNVTNLAEARNVFKRLVKIVVYLTRHLG